MKNISVLIKPASGACNMTCDYCFYCDEAAKREQKFYGMMSEETLKNMIRRTMLHSEGSVSYTWQGGEPTLRGLDFFRKALYLQKKYNRNHLQVINAFQTNGYGITDDWCMSNDEETNNLIVFCKTPRTRKEICDYLGLNSVTYAIQTYVNPLVEVGVIKLSIPDKPKSPKQLYYSGEREK